MSVAKHVRRVWATLESPFVSQGLWAYAPGLDTALARDHLDRLIIPGSQLRGVLRNVLCEMADARQTKFNLADLEAWFGQGSGDAYGEPPKEGPQDHFLPQKGLVRFDDLICQAQVKDQGGATTRIRLEEGTGSVAKGALQVVEMPFPYGAQVPFAGEITFYGDDAADYKDVAAAARFWEVLSLALKFVPALGAIKSSGFGNLARPLELTVPEDRAAPLVDFSPAQGLELADRLAVELTFQEPFVVDATLIGGNIYQGSWIIPGAVVKGCLARQLKLADAFEGLKTALSETVFSHAFPVQAGIQDAKRPHWMPLSLIEVTEKTKGGKKAEEPQKIYDCLWAGDKPRWDNQQIAYSIDWKSPSCATANGIMGWPQEPDYHVRTRTAINTANKVAEEGKLFSYREVEPGCLRWRMVLDRGDADQGQFRQIVGALLGGLEFVGKTDARAHCRLVDDPAIQAMAEPLASDPGHLWRITLQTPALLFNPEKAVRLNQGQASPRDLYQKYFEALVGLWTWETGTPVVVLQDFRAAQKWEGGYRARRFHRDLGFYLPYLLTQAGSVFIVTIQGPGTQEQAVFFNHLCRHGLPLYDGKLSQPERWEKCPYTPENGYGEVRVDWDDARLFEGGVPVA